ncbi:MAG: DUF1778 domain-containing protein [Pirellula sp.]
MATANSTSKSARIETRVSQEQKNPIERAAAFSGRTVSEFVLAHVEKAAKKPNKKLKLAMEHYRKRV